MTFVEALGYRNAPCLYYPPQCYLQTLCTTSHFRWMKFTSHHQWGFQKKLKILAFEYICGQEEEDPYVPVQDSWHVVPQLQEWLGPSELKFFDWNTLQLQVLVKWEESMQWFECPYSYNTPEAVFAANKDASPPAPPQPCPHQKTLISVDWPPKQINRSADSQMHQIFSVMSWRRITKQWWICQQNLQLKSSSNLSAFDI